ncbi:hypothetical protein OKW43_005745 [Paraburkholderia sp. WC7.3g]|uniref:hypothetical protein n=1 Tax=Paraburkholderia sp. WC7.3g TaxID=2991070 RepID=UPI003D193E82
MGALGRIERCKHFIAIRIRLGAGTRTTDFAAHGRPKEETTHRHLVEELLAVRVARDADHFLQNSIANVAHIEIGERVAHLVRHVGCGALLRHLDFLGHSMLHEERKHTGKNHKKECF